jgi:serine/threonine protein kinase
MDTFSPSSPYGGSSYDSRTVIGRFQIEGLIGKGGMGKVLKARDPNDGRLVALKILDIEAYADDELRRRFEREAKSASLLDHANIAHIYGMELDENGHPVLVMEYIEGLPLDTIIKDNPDVSFSKMVDFVIQGARGLEYAYRRSIIHRDIKPSNLILASNGVLKIIDFGLAKSLWDNTSLTATGMVVGTPRYISPEQGMGRNVDHRADIYSLGATFYELLTRQTPFDGETPLAIMMKHISSPLVPPYFINPRTPADMSDIIMRMMAKDPSARYQDYEPLIRDLESAKIHRLAKERRMNNDMSDAHTMVMPPADGENGSTTMLETSGLPDSPGSRPSSYLTEGLVDVSFAPDETESHASPMKMLFLSLAGLAIIGFAVIFMLQPVQDETGARQSRFSADLAKIIGRSKSAVASPKNAEQIVQQDTENIQRTKSRMEAIVSRIIQMRQSGTLADVPTIKMLREKNIVSEEESRDAWGNDFYIVSRGPGGGTLVALGRDGQDKTADDFSLSLDGQSQVVPPAMSLVSAQDKKEPTAHPAN